MRDLAEKLDACEDLDDEIDEILHDFESTSERPFLHSVIFYWILIFSFDTSIMCGANLPANDIFYTYIMFLILKQV